MNPTLFAIAIAFIILDIVSGVVKALKNHSIKSVIMREGIYHKSGFIIMLIVGVLCQYSSELDPQLMMFASIYPLTCIFVVFTELTSIMENLMEISPELAKNPIWKILDSNKEE